MCSYQTRNKNSKKIQKIRKHHHSFFSSQNRLRKAEKERKKKSFGCVPTQPVIKIPKKQQKNSKNQKTLSQILFKPKLVGRGREREKKNRSDVVLADLNRKLKKKAKKFKKLENTVVASFQAKIGCERLRKREKKKSFRCVPTRTVIKIPKKQQKNSKNQ